MGNPINGKSLLIGYLVMVNCNKGSDILIWRWILEKIIVIYNILLEILDMGYPQISLEKVRKNGLKSRGVEG